VGKWNETEWIFTIPRTTPAPTAPAAIRLTLRNHQSALTSRGVTERLLFKYMETEQFFHANMGWYGQANGYYLPKLFDTNNPVVSSLMSTGTPGIYRCYFDMVIGMRP